MDNNGVHHEMDRNYLKRGAEPRISRLIDAHIPVGLQVAVDAGCGSGCYGRALSQKAERVYGLDVSPLLCQAARDTGWYQAVYCDRIERIAEHLTGADAVFCSEVLEHLPPAQRSVALEQLHGLRPRVLVFTMPNPWSPHYRADPTHVGDYSVHSVKCQLNSISGYAYQMKALGFSDFNLRRSRFFRLLNSVSSRVPSLSPTVAFVGKARG